MTMEESADEKSRLKIQALATQLGLTMEEVEANKYSKKHLKRMIRNKHYHEFKADKRKIQREKKKLKRKELKDRNLLPVEKPKRISMQDSPNKVKIAIDLSFNSLMNDKEMRKLFKQIQRCYSYNRRSPAPCQFYLTSVNGSTLANLNEKQPGFANWEICGEERHFLEVFQEEKEKGTLILLSPNSPNLLPDPSEIQKRGGDYVYIIGGLVDHNVQKGLTLKIAEQNGIGHARLPIDKCIQLCVSHVLSVNHVFEIMVNASLGISWTESFLKVIPQRKQILSEQLLAKRCTKENEKKDESTLLES